MRKQRQNKEAQQTHAVLLIRLDPIRPGWFTYIITIDLLLLYLCGDLSYLLGFIGLSLENAFPKIYQIIVFKWNDGIITFLGLCLLYACIGGALFVMTRKYFRELKGLLTLKYPSSQEAMYQTLKKMIFLLVPPWLSAQVLNSPPPTVILDAAQSVQESRSALNHWSEHTSQETEASEEPTSTLHIRLSFSKNLVFTLSGRDGKQERVPIATSSWVALLAYLALQHRGEWISKDTLLSKVYGDSDEGKFAALRVHIQRIHKLLNDKAEEAGLLPFIHNGEQCSTITIIEDSGREKTRAWRLSSLCEVEIFSRLTTTYTLLKTVQENPQHHIYLPAESHNKLCMDAYEEYGKGFLSSYESLLNDMRWLSPVYKKYRDWCLFLLSVATHTEHSRSTDPALPPDERTEAQNLAAQYAGWQALVASGWIPIPGNGEEALKQCLRLYRDLQDLIAARFLFQDYKKQRREKDIDWNPSDSLFATWPEATRRARKSAMVDDN